VYPLSIKRIFDFTLAGLSLALLWPLLLIVAVAIRLDSLGPALYRGCRAGRNGHPFFILKFRTMVVNADKLGGPSTSNDDPRITRFGKFLRKYKLDEFPQLINVLIGEMSFVGPRPEVLSEVQAYSSEERELLSVTPGITDWASLHFRNEGQILAGSPDPHQAYLERIRPEKIKLGLQYVRQHSLRTDAQILLQTIATLSHIGRGNE
jgi:lipopolysaccharide/colanic/teichoic acid biosynthesis glycosyltransferase